MTAKKRQVVSYEGTLLLPRIHDDVEITLLLSSIPDTPLPDHSKRDTAAAAAAPTNKQGAGVGAIASCTEATEKRNAGD